MSGINLNSDYSSLEQEMTRDNGNQSKIDQDVQTFQQQADAAAPSGQDQTADQLSTLLQSENDNGNGGKFTMQDEAATAEKQETGKVSVGSSLGDNFNFSDDHNQQIIDAKDELGLQVQTKNSSDMGDTVNALNSLSPSDHAQTGSKQTLSDAQAGNWSAATSDDNIVNQ